MSRRYTLEECCAVLDIHQKTFKRWLKDDHIATERSKADKRIKFLTEEQVKHLAELHDKPWPPPANQEAEVIPVTAYKLLIEQVERVEQQTEQISTTQATLQAGIVELRGRQEITASVVTAIQQEHTRSTEAEQPGTQTPQEHENQIVSLQETLEKYQKQTHVVLDSLTTGQQEATARLDNLTTTGQEQQKQLEQLTSRLDTLEDLAQRIQNDTPAQIEQVQTRLQAQQAQFQSDLATIRQELQEEFNQQIHRIVAELAQDMAKIATQQGMQTGYLEQLGTRVVSAVSVAEEAKATASRERGRIESTERALANLQQQIQAEMTAQADLTERITRLETEEEAQEAAPKEPATRRRTNTRKATEVVESTT